MRRTGGGGGGVNRVKNRNGQWEGPGEGELNGYIMHQVHTSLTSCKKIDQKTSFYEKIKRATKGPTIIL
jgi:hypothetical protein